MKKRLIGVIGILLPVLLAAQNIRPLHVGDSLSKSALFNILDNPVSQVQLTSLENKNILIDFWATYCTSCIKHFEEMDQLQKKYNDQLQIILINSPNSVDTKQKLSSFINNYLQDHKGFSLPFINNGMAAKQVFPHLSLPHYVWMNAAGKIVAITNAAAITEQNIHDFLLQKTLLLPEKNEADTSVPFKKIIGRVKDLTTDNILPAAIIQSVKTGKKVSTDRNGLFELELSPLDTVTISYAGYNILYKPVMSFNPDRPLNILLQLKGNELGEVTVYTGYQSLPKERATGSFDILNNKVLSEQVSTNITDKLEAVTNGLLVDRKTSTTPNFVIRGISTLLGAKGPLIVVDDFPYDGDINNINPNDVENITVLKDAAASSIWGAKAGNGVIVITTKKSRLNHPLALEFNTNISIVNKPDLGYIKQMTSGDFIDVEQMLYGKGFYNSQIGSTSKPPLSQVVELLIARDNGTITAAYASARMNAMRSTDIRNDFNKYVYRQAVNRQFALNLKGGSLNHAWLLSGAYDYNTDALTAQFTRVNLRTEHTVKINNILELTAGLYFTKSSSVAGKTGYNDLITSSTLASVPPYAQLADAQGNPLPIVKDYRQTYKDTAGGGYLLNWNYYPLTDYQHINNTTSQQDIRAHAALMLHPLKNLDISVKYQYEQQQTNGRIIYDTAAYFTRNLINLYSQLNRNTGAVTYIVPKGGISDFSYTPLVSQNIRTQINYNRHWGIHSMTVLLGNEIREAQTNTNSYRLYGYNSDIQSYSNVDYANTYATFITGSKAFIPNNFGLSQALNRFVSFYSNAAYTLKNRYTLSASARRDASNLFGANTNNRWTPLWSAGFAWDIARESFWKSKTIPFLKLRASYGFSGNINPNVAAVTTIQYQTTSPYTQSPYANISNYLNPDLRWENVNTLNVGIDLKWLHNRVLISADYFNKNMKDLFSFYPLDYTVGFSSITKNAANAVGNGVDLDITTMNTVGKIQWSTQLNASYYKDKVTQYYLSSTQGSNFVGSTQPPISGIIGDPVYSMLAYQWGGLDPQTGDPQGYLNKALSKDYSNITGKGTQVTDLVYKGTIFPMFYGSMGNTISWKRLEFTVRILYKLGYYFRRSGINYTSLFNNWKGHSEFALRWQKPGDENITNVPSMVYPAVSARDNFYAGSEATVEKGDNIRLQYINLAYNITKNKSNHLPFKNMQLYINCSNIGILWRANTLNIDPDYKDGALPPSLTTAVGCRIQF